MSSKKKLDVTSLSLRLQFKVLREVFTQYVFRNRRLRLLLLPYILLVVLAKMATMRAIMVFNKFVKANSDSAAFSEGTLLVYFFALTYFHIFVNEAVSFAFTPFIQRAFRKATTESFNNFLFLEYGTFKKIGCGEIHSSVERRSAAVSDILEVVLIEAVPIALAIGIACTELHVATGVHIPLMTLIAVALLLFATVRITNHRTILRREVNRRLNHQSNVMYDALINYETVLSHNAQSLEVARFDRLLARTNVLYVELYRSYYALNYVQKFIMTSLLVSVLSLPYLFPGYFHVEPHKLFAFVRIHDALASALHKTGYIYSKYAIGIINYETSKAPRCSPKKKNLLALPPVKSHILFENVSIYYDSRVLIQDLTFSIVLGEKIAIVGRNGIGKSSLLKTLMGFTKYKGRILIDNKDLQTFSIKSIRDRISYIHQDSGIFNETIKYNIAYGDPAITDDKITDICRQINVHESITRLNKGYNTVCGERGSNLSGGEKQKIAFARACAKNSDILILDEPTASLDKHSECNILEMVFAHAKSQSIFIIVHNLDLLVNFNKIIFLQSREEKEIGSFVELMAKKGFFYEFMKQHNTNSVNIEAPQIIDS